MSEIERNSKNLHLPEGFNWPKPVQKEIALWDKAYKEWAEVSTTLAE